MKNIVYLCALFVLSLVSCIDDDSRDVSVTLPELTIPGSDSETMPVYNIYYGQEPLVIDPKVETNSKNLTYEWSLGTYTEISSTNIQKGELTKISTDPILNYSFDEKGSYYVHLTVTDGVVGDVMEYRVNVNDYYEKGILVIANSEDNKGNLGFIKDLTEEDITNGMTYHVEEHSLEKQNPDITIGKIIGADRTNASSMPFSQVPVMLVALEDQCLFVNSTTFEINASSAYSSIFSGFKATHFLSSDSYASAPFVYDVNSKHSIHIQKAYWFLLENAYDFYQQAYDDVITGYNYQASISSWQLDAIFFDYKNSEICSFSNNIGDKAGTGELLAGKNILMATRDKSGATLYIVVNDKENPQEITQYTVTQTYTEDFSGAYYDKKKETTYVASTMDGIPSQGTRLIFAKNYQVAYYAIGNSLYAYYLLNATPTLPTKPIITYEGEQITSVSMNDASNQLYVGTYTPETQRGNVYIYNISDLTNDNYTPKFEFKQCTDKIVDIRYKN